jgi:hypothetical protein
MSYQEAMNRIRAEYAEMPGMRLTREQVHRLSGVEIAVCRAVLDDLIRTKFLNLAADGRYAKRTDTSSPRLRMEKAELDSGTVASRRAS